MLKLKADKREIFGKQLKAPRKEGQLPVVIYGAKAKNQSLFVDAKNFKKILKQAGESSVVTLETDGGNFEALIHDVAYHPVSGEPLHADFYAVEANKPVQVAVALTLTGVAPAIKELGANLVQVLHEVEVEALPRHLPHELTLDVSGLNTLESRLTVADIKLPPDVTLVTSAEEVAVLINLGGEEVKEEEVPFDITQIEVEKKGKEAKEGEEPEEAEATTETKAPEKSEKKDK